MCSKQKRRFKSQCIQHDYANINHISYECKCKFDRTKYNSNQW